MAHGYISMQAGAEVEFPVALYTGTRGERRIQSATPVADVRNSNPEVATVELIEGPKIKVVAVSNGVTRVRINTGGVFELRITVEDVASGLAWEPDNSGLVVTKPPAQIDTFPPGSVDGPNSSPHGDDYWLQRDMSDNWYIWWDVDTDPGPDVKKPLQDFLTDENVDQAYRDDVLARAEELGYGS